VAECDTADILLLESQSEARDRGVNLMIKKYTQMQKIHGNEYNQLRPDLFDVVGTPRSLST
jgi:hypothetical protein